MTAQCYSQRLVATDLSQSLLQLQSSILCNMKPTVILPSEIRSRKRGRQWEVHQTEEVSLWTPPFPPALQNKPIYSTPSARWRGPSGTPVSSPWLKTGSSRPTQISKVSCGHFSCIQADGPVSQAKRGVVGSASMLPRGGITASKPTKKSVHQTWRCWPYRYACSISRGNSPLWSLVVLTFNPVLTPKQQQS